MNKKVTDKTFLVLGMIIVFMGMSLIDNLIGNREYRAIQPYWNTIGEYQLNIKPEMIMSIVPDGRYSGKPIVDWKLDDLALAMATAQEHSPSRPLSYGSLDITLDTMGTGIEPNIWFDIGYENFDYDGDFIVYFELEIMKDGEPYASRDFMGEGLNEWARSVGIADKENW